MSDDSEMYDPAQALNDAQHRWRRWYPAPEPMPLHLRLALLLAITVGHILLVWVIDRSSYVEPRPVRERITTLVFLDPPPPVEEPEPEPVPVPEVTQPDPVPEPERTQPDPVPEPPEEELEPEPVPETQTDPVPEPEPEVVPAPVEELVPEAEPVPVPEPDPEPALEPEPVIVPDPVIVRTPLPDPAPERISVPAPEIRVTAPAPDSGPAAVSAQAPERVAISVPVLTPDPIRKKKPELAPVLGDVPTEEPEAAEEVAPDASSEAMASSEPDPAPSGQSGGMQAVELPARAGGTSLRLFNPDGSLYLPDDVKSQLRSVTDDERRFSFEQPGLMESGRFMQRQPALVYEPTRFDRYWVPEKDVLTSLLERAVEATTGTVEIPIPGSPGSKLVCTVAILAAGGGCGIRNNNDGYVVELNDPDTLNAEEARQCKEWWDRIVGATVQSVWRNTRDLYDAQCRKPLEVDTSVPLPKS